MREYAPVVEGLAIVGGSLPSFLFFSISSCCVCGNWYSMITSPSLFMSIEELMFCRLLPYLIRPEFMSSSFGSKVFASSGLLTLYFSGLALGMSKLLLSEESLTWALVRDDFTPHVER